MLYRIAELAVLPQYRLRVQFEDGTAGTIDLSGEMHGPMFEPLRDEGLFAQAYLDEFGVVCWPNGADYAPDATYEVIASDSGASRPKSAAGTAGR